MEKTNNDKLIKCKCEELLKVNENIRSLEKQLIELKNKRNTINNFISSNCEHVWIKEMDYFQYSKSYNLCVKCRTIRGVS